MKMMYIRKYKHSATVTIYRRYGKKPYHGNRIISKQYYGKTFIKTMNKIINGR